MMYLGNIKLRQFRNYKELSINFNSGINIIYGDNAQGKTNLLESIHVLALTKSHRSLNDDSLIENGKTEFKISGNCIINNISTIFEILMQNKKKYYIDGDEIKVLSNYLSKMKVIIFFPEDLQLIKGSPLERRRYINMQISQLDNNYYKVLNDYNKLLKIRNDLLKKNLKGEKINKEYFSIITDYLINKQVIIYKMRKKYIDRINLYVENIYNNIAEISGFNIKYITNTEINNYEEILLKETLKEKFCKIYNVEIKVGTTLIGPHRDDIDFLIDKQSLKNYGSQGQQRIAVLALKLAEVELFKKYSNDNPILLLDDVFSELSDIKKNKLLNYINEDIQTIITTTELDNLDNSILNKSKLIEIREGKIIN